MRRAATLVAVVGALLALFAGAALAAVVDGDRRDNTLVGAEREDTIRGIGGDDAVYGMGGADGLSGGDGDDKIYGGDEDDTLYGGPGRDTVQGGEGDDVLAMRDGVAVNDTARCGTGYADVARVDSRAEALVPNSRCETFEFDHKATGVLERNDTDLVIEDTPTHLITDRSGARYGLSSETVDLSAHEGRRVTVSGWVETSRPGEGGRMDVERVEER
jgi:Ca2+-binding RTX toxin-like protein